MIRCSRTSKVWNSNTFQKNKINTRNNLVSWSKEIPQPVRLLLKFDLCGEDSAILYGVCMFSQCMNGFSCGTTPSLCPHAPQMNVNAAEWLFVYVPWDWLAYHCVSRFLLEVGWNRQTRNNGKLNAHVDIFNSAIPKRPQYPHYMSDKHLKHK